MKKALKKITILTKRFSTGTSAKQRLRRMLTQHRKLSVCKISWTWSKMKFNSKCSCSRATKVTCLIQHSNTIHLKNRSRSTTRFRTFPKSYYQPLGSSKLRRICKASQVKMRGTLSNWLTSLQRNSTMTSRHKRSLWT